MRELSQYLIDSIEILPQIVEDKIGEHVKVIGKMEKCNAKKAKAAEDEDFELAAKYKNKHLKLKSQLISFSDVQKMMNAKPEMTMHQLLHLQS